MSDLTTLEINDLVYWSRRYADARSTYVTREVNQIIDKLRKAGVIISKDKTLKDPQGLYASDGMLGFWRDGRFVKVEEKE